MWSAPARGAELRVDVIDSVRNTAIGALFGPPGEPWCVSGRAIAEPALEAEFGDAADYRSDLPSRAIPVNDPTAGLAAREGTTAEASLLSDLVALAHSYGSTIVFVRAPLPVGSQHLDQVSPEREAASLALLNGLDAAWLDLHRLPLPADAFGDAVHASESGRAAVSAAIAQAFADADVLGGGALPRASPPTAPVAIAREGTPPTVAVGPLRQLSANGCIWVATLPDLGFLADDVLTAAGPGPVGPVAAREDGLHLRPHVVTQFAEAPCTASLQHLSEGLTFSPGAPATAPALDVGLAEEVPTLSAAGEPARLEVAGVSAPLLPHGRLFQATLTPPPPTGTWEIRVAAGPGAWLLIEEVRLGEDAPVELVGGPLQPVNLLATQGLVWQRRTLPAMAPEFATAEATLDRTGEACPALHAGGTPDNPGALERVGCRGPGGWLLPGDHANVTARPEFLDRLRLGADRILLTGYAFGADARGTAPIVVEVTPHDADGPVLARGTGELPLVGPLTRLEISLDHALAPRAQVDVHLLRPDDGRYVLLRAAWLGESEAAAPAA